MEYYFRTRTVDCYTSYKLIMLVWKWPLDVIERLKMLATWHGGKKKEGMLAG